ncbi:thermonuclease family protein [Aeoliella sp.]|uniref:thermonuclease family protein n=1 Tax=Aeoliella sp. TaxID=2795800 RepID=UPI003CCBD410
MRRKCRIISVAIGWSLTISVAGQPIAEDDLLPAEQVTVARVTTGDSFYVRTSRGGYRIRLLGVAAPRKLFDEPNFKESKQALQSLLAGRELRVRLRETTENETGPRVGLAWLGDDLVNRSVVASGYAWYQPAEFASPDMQTAFDEAKQAKRALWGKQDPPVPPWKSEAIIEQLRVHSDSSISAREVWKFHQEYEKQYVDAMALLEKVRAYHDPQGQRDKLRQGQVHIRCTASIPNTNPVQNVDMIDAQFAWVLPDRFYGKGELRFFEQQEFEIALSHGAGWLSVDGNLNGMPDAAKGADGMEIRSVLLPVHSLAAVFAPSSLAKLGESTQDPLGLRFYAHLHDTKSNTDFLIVRPLVLGDDDIPFPLLRAKYIALAFDPQTGRQVGLAPVRRFSKREKLLGFLPPHATSVLRISEEQTVAGMKLPKTIDVMGGKVQLADWVLGSVKDEKVFNKPQPAAPVGNE